jgi:hypothetical protein
MTKIADLAIAPATTQPTTKTAGTRTDLSAAEPASPEAVVSGEQVPIQPASARPSISAEAVEAIRRRVADETSAMNKRFGSLGGL